MRNANYNTWNISYSCDTSGGNSGSPVLNASHRVIALHHLGGCPSNQGAKAHLIYNEIASLIETTAETVRPRQGPPNGGPWHPGEDQRRVSMSMTKR